MNWLKSWLLTILQKVFPSEKPDYQDLQAWAKEQVVHPIYSVELDCYRHGFPPVALEEHSIGVWSCPICSKPKPAVWVDEITQEQIHAYIPPEPRADPAQLSRLGMRSRAMTRQLQEHPGTLMQHHRALLKKAQMVKLDPETMIMPAAPRLARILDEPPAPDATGYEVPAFLKDRAV